MVRRRAVQINDLFTLILTFLVGFSTVYLGLERSAMILGKSVAGQTVQTVQYKWVIFLCCFHSSVVCICICIGICICICICNSNAIKINYLCNYWNSDYWVDTRSHKHTHTHMHTQKQTNLYRYYTVHIYWLLIWFDLKNTGYLDISIFLCPRTTVSTFWWKTTDTSIFWIAYSAHRLF